MARPLRIEYEGACYHILSRGNNRTDIFKTKEDYKDFLSLLEELSERFSVVIYAYTLMGNHYHLLLKTQDANLSRAMQWLGTSYTRRFNIRNEQSGHLFQGRFKSILVEDDAYFVNLSCYIHRNPLRAGIVKRLSDYPWSSYLYYAYGKTGPGWLDTDTLLFHFGQGEDRHAEYCSKVKQYSNEDESIRENVKYGFIIGSQAFIEHIKKKYLSDRPDKELPQLNRLLNADDPKFMISKICQVLDFDIEVSKLSGRLIGENCDKRDVLIRFLWETGKYSNHQIGEFVGLTYSSVSKRLNRTAKSLKGRKENNFRKLYDQAKMKFQFDYTNELADKNNI